MRLPKRYLPKVLSKKDVSLYAKEVAKSRKLYKQGKYHTRKTVKSFKSKESKHVKRAKSLYNVKTMKPSKKLAHATGCSIHALNKIVDKGEGAYFSSGSRPNQTAMSWGLARLASSVTGGKSAAVDWHIIKDHCKKSGKAYKLAIAAKAKHGKGTRRVPKRK